MWREIQVGPSMLLLTLLNFGLCAAQVLDLDYTSATLGSRCYDDLGNPQRCIPEFVNAAYNVIVESNNTCGEFGPTEYCSQTGARGPSKTCEVCDSSVPELAHPREFLTDFNNADSQTYWQSETMLEGVQWPNRISLVLRFKKSFDITYVRVKFQSPRPESFAIYKRSSEDGPWIPYQYYSATCRDSYGIPDRSYVSRDDESKALCTSEFSDISPLTGGNVAFSTLEGRPSAYDFENSKALQEWVTATDIMIVLNRLNTFGDEVFGDPKVLKSYFYAISDIAVGGRCKCNGHASECVPSTSIDGDSRLVCRCEHNTDGPDCNTCSSFFNDRPWKRATSLEANECKQCNCNGFANRCFFDQALYESTGHGGHCLDCTGNRDGPNCERCKENHYSLDDGYCVDCQCHEIGSRSLQCNREGKCPCKPGVTGDKCDRCADNFYDFGPQGCKACGCNSAGSLGNQPRCDPGNGRCLCKENVEGQRCDICKPGYFNLDDSNDFGCNPCFCYGHSSVCRSAPGYSKGLIESVFARNDEKWTAVERSGSPISISYNPVIQNVGASATGDTVYFFAPERYLGDHRASYNQDISFVLRIGESTARATIEDVVLEGSGLTISQPIFGQGNPLPTIQNQQYRFKLHESPDYGWTPRLTSRDFISILANLTAIKIRATYTPRGVGFLDDVKLTTGRRGGLGTPATWIERCQCPEGYVGQFCESCAPGYRHDPPMGGPFARCVPCNCNGHADICDAETGRCICNHNTAGDNCERCARGFYGNSLRGQPDDCSPCPCPNNGACIELADSTVVCLECPVGYAGPRCELCSDGYFGDPEGRVGPRRPCQPCDCTNNVDPNAVGNCNRTTGECLKCIYSTGGFRCDMCLPGFFGDALSPTKGDCKGCSCYHKGTVLTSPTGPPVCDQNTGVCDCKPNVIGRNCDKCEEGFFNIESGNGCESCECDRIGSIDSTCDITTGQCRCRPGIVGRRCDQCEVNHYGFSTGGCKHCDCDPIGSVSLQCSPTGQCPCRENVEGRRCDRCKENKQNREIGCVDCPACYNLVQDAANDHRAKLSELRETLEKIISSPTLINDEDFDRKLNEVQDRVEKLFMEARVQSGGDQSVSVRLDELRRRLLEVQKAVAEIREQMGLARVDAEFGAGNVTQAESALERARESLKASQRFLELEGSEALQRAIQRSEKFGQQSEKMSANAREARNIADNLESIATSVEEAANEALTVSSNAYNFARDAIDKQRETTEEIRRLQTDVRRTNAAVDETHQLAERALEAARTAHNDALTLLGEATALTIPNLDWQGIKSEATAAGEGARRIKQEVEDLLDQNQQLVQDALLQAQDGTALVSRGVATQQQIDELLAEIDAALAKSDGAVALGDKTLKEAQETLETLKGFDSLVQESKDKAADALSRVSEIEQLVTQAEDKAAQAVAALNGAARDASFAKDLAQEAEKVALQASKEAQNIRQTASSTKERAGSLRDSAQDLAGKVASTTGRLQTLETEAGEDQALVKESLEKANRAKEIATESSGKVREALASVTDILSTLENAGSIDPSNLAELERKLGQAERSFQEAGVEKRTEELRQSRIQQVQWVRDYDSELAKLRSEVDNVQAIRDALPDNCWKRLKLEP